MSAGSGIGGKLWLIPMQPRPIAETSSPCPRVLFFISPDHGTLSDMRALVYLAAVLAVLGAATARAAPAEKRHRPYVLRYVDTSRTIKLPNGKLEPRPVTTVFWYPPARDGNGPFPLVVFGHGFAARPSWYRRLLRGWAAAGYVVAAPIFPLGNANAPGGPNEADIVNQPRDMSFVITRVLAASASGKGALAGLVDPGKVAVAGQSDGAMTAFAAAYESPWRDDRVHAALVLSGAILGPRRYVVHDRRAAPRRAGNGGPRPTRRSTHTSCSAPSAGRSSFSCCVARAISRRTPFPAARSTPSST